jgi:hypothetical protein
VPRRPHRFSASGARRTIRTRPLLGQNEARSLRFQHADEYRSRYAALLRHGTENPGDMPSTADFGSFDLSGVGKPRMLQKTLVFYAEDSLYSVPYRVEVPWPPDAGEPVRFLLLPLQG